MTDPRHASHIPGMGRYYTRPSTGEQLISVTNVLDIINKPALVPWASKAVAEHAWGNIPRLVAASRHGDEGRDAMLRELKSQPDVVRERASDLGTRVHKLAEAHVLGKPMPDDEEAAPFLGQYLAWLDEFGIDIDRDIVASECTVMNPRIGYAGTLDLLVRLPFTGLLVPGAKVEPTEDGARLPWIVDIKTSSTQPANKVYETYALQQTAYRHGQLILLDDGTEEPMPRGIVGVAVLNLRATEKALIPLPSRDAEWRAFQAAHDLAVWRQSTWHGTATVPVGPDGTPAPKKRAPRKTATKTTAKKAAAKSAPAKEAAA